MANKRTTKLTPKQAKFVDEYLIDLNATQAAIRAGYSEKTAVVTGCQNLIKPNIAQAVAKAKKTRVERTKIDADYVLQRHVEIDQMDVLDILENDGKIKAVQDWPKCWRQTLSGYDIATTQIAGTDMETVLKKIKWPDKVRNLELLGKHVDVGAYKELSKTDLNVTGLGEILREMSGESRGLPDQSEKNDV